MIKIYGIKNCNSIKKTLNWFEENKIDYEFHDYKKHNIEKAKLRVSLIIYQLIKF